MFYECPGSSVVSTHATHATPLVQIGQRFFVGSQTNFYLPLGPVSLFATNYPIKALKIDKCTFFDLLHCLVLIV